MHAAPQRSPRQRPGDSVDRVSSSPLPVNAARIVAIDVMRGLTLALMIVVNMSISETQAYAPLLHATWHGLTLTDLVFPSFLFVVGCSMAFTLDRYEARGTAVFLGKVARRTALIFLCGFLLYWFPFFRFDAAGHLALRPLAEARIPGVLQRIALCYGIAALIVHAGGTRAAVAFGVVALAGYAALLARFGDLTLAGNAVLRLDRWLLGDAHLYRGEGIAFDPEGLLSTLPAIANVLAGWLAGQHLRRHGASGATVVRLLAAGVLALAAGWIWAEVLPFNKKLWTSSYALATAGVATLLLALLVECFQRHTPPRWGWFFEIFGRNTLFLYLVAEVAMAVLWLTQVGRTPTMQWLYDTGLRSWLPDKPAGLLFALLFMLACWGLGWAMDRKRLYVKL